MLPPTGLPPGPDVDWSDVIDRLLHAETQEERDHARKTMWVAIEQYVVYRAKLPIGPLGDDEEVRRNVSVAVMAKLQGDGFAAVARFRRHRSSRDIGTFWWKFIRTIAARIAIDVARGSDQNVASRGEGKFRWARVEPTPPETLTGILDAQGESILHHIHALSPRELVAYLKALQGIPREENDECVDPLNRRALDNVTPPGDDEPVENTDDDDDASRDL